MISAIDEGRHDKTDDKFWQESYYFNFVDAQAGVYGFTRLGWRVNEGEVDGILFVIRGKDLWYAYPPVNRPFSEPWENVRLPEQARVRRLVYKMDEPFKRWRLILEGKKDCMDLEFECFTPVYDYNAEKKSLPENVAAMHYEQSGRVRGKLKLRGREVEINGTGQRDHSWGIRDWAGVEGWRWITAQFSDKFSFNIFSVNSNGAEHAGGFVFDGKDNARVVNSDIQLTLASDNQTPAKALLLLTDEHNRTHEITAEVFHMTPLRRHGAFIKECFARFHYNGLEGCGVIERLHQPDSKLDDLRYVGQAAAYAWRWFRNK